MCIGMGHVQREAKACNRCGEQFTPTGVNCKRCPPCRHAHHLESCKKRWHTTYVKKGRNQKGENNNAWKGGSSPAYYQKVAFSTHGDRCLRCRDEAVLVHHKDGNRKNPDPSNLEVLCKRCHQLEHDCAGNLPQKVKFKPRTCARCGERFHPTGPRGIHCRACRRSESKGIVSTSGNRGRIR